MNNFNYNKIQCKKMHWMTESVWSWYIIYTDHMSVLTPRVAVDAPYFIRCSKCNALGHWTRSQGPPKG